MTASRSASAGILLYRFAAGGPELFLGHMGGPYWAAKDLGAWTVPKGEIHAGEDPLSAARREFEEETGHALSGPFRELLPIKQKSGKTVYAWAVEGNIDPASLRSNLFEMEWPPRSGQRQQFPELDRAGWFDVASARQKLVAGQQGLVDQLLSICLQSGSGA